MLLSPRRQTTPISSAVLCLYFADKIWDTCQYRAISLNLAVLQLFRQFPKASLGVNQPHPHNNYLNTLDDLDSSFQTLMKPQFAKACYNIAMLHDRLGDINKASAYYKRALDKFPDQQNVPPFYSKVLTNYAVTLEKLGKREEAMGVLEMSGAWEGEEDEVRVYNNKGIIQKRKGDLKEAMASYQAAIDRDIYNWQRAWRRVSIKSTCISTQPCSWREMYLWARSFEPKDQGQDPIPYPSPPQLKPLPAHLRLCHRIKRPCKRSHRGKQKERLASSHQASLCEQAPVKCRCEAKPAQEANGIARFLTTSQEYELRQQQEVYQLESSTGFGGVEEEC